MVPLFTFSSPLFFPAGAPTKLFISPLRTFSNRSKSRRFRNKGVGFTITPEILMSQNPSLTLEQAVAECERLRQEYVLKANFFHRLRTLKKLQKSQTDPSPSLASKTSAFEPQTRLQNISVFPPANQKVEDQPKYQTTSPTQPPVSQSVWSSPPHQSMPKQKPWSKNNLTHYPKSDTQGRRHHRGKGPWRPPTGPQFKPIRRGRRNERFVQPSHRHRAQMPVNWQPVVMTVKELRLHRLRKSKLKALPRFKLLHQLYPRPYPPSFWKANVRPPFVRQALNHRRGLGRPLRSLRLHFFGQNLAEWTSAWKYDPKSLDFEERLALTAPAYVHRGVFHRPWSYKPANNDLSLGFTAGAFQFAPVYLPRGKIKEVNQRRLTAAGLKRFWVGVRQSPDKRHWRKPKVKAIKSVHRLNYTLVKNNLFLNLSDRRGNPLKTLSSGLVKLQGSQRKTIHAANLLGRLAAQWVVRHRCWPLRLISLTKPDKYFKAIAATLERQLYQYLGRRAATVINSVEVAWRWPHSLGQRPKKERHV